MPTDEERDGLVSFTLASVQANDLVSILKDYAVAIRIVDPCTQPG